MEYSGPTIFELGEREALKRAVSVFKPGEFTILGSGDDSAIIRSTGSYAVTTDTMVEGRDFRLDFSTGFDLGYKAIATNFSDVAAMGARPTAAVVALVVPVQTKQSWLEDFARGLQAGIDQLSPGAELVGGDLAAGEQLMIAVTAHGELLGEPVTRSGSKPGDLVAIAGTLGRAACGLDLLLAPDKTLAAAYDEWVSTQLRPNPPIQAGLQASGLASAMLDVSDGLSLDAQRLAQASNVTIRLHSSALSGYQAVLELAAQSMQARGLQVNAIDWVLHGGEDHALLATFPREVSIPKGFKVIGEVLEKSGADVFLDSDPLESKGWDSIRQFN